MNIYVKGVISALILAMGLLIFWSFTVGFSKPEAPDTSLKILDQLEKDGIPSFTLNDLNGKPFAIESLKGKIIVLNFWATWCAPCVEEMPSMITMLEKFGGDVRLVTVSADERKDDIDRFVKALNLKSEFWVSLWDPDMKVAKQFGTQRLPETYILNRKFKLAKKVVNSFDWNSLPVIQYLGSLQR